VRIAALLLVALALTGCETTAEKSAKLEKRAKRITLTQQKGLSISHPSVLVKVVETAVVHSSEGTAAVITLHNSSAKPLRALPIAITVKDAKGASLYTNSTPGLSSTLVSVGLLPAHGELTWIDDQVQTTGVAAGASAVVGEGGTVSAQLPDISVQGASVQEGSAEGTVVNHSAVAQRELVVYAVARRGGRIVAAGRAVLASVPANASTRFQVFFIGDPRGAQLQVSAPATTLG
jgi:hypothetical protein